MKATALALVDSNKTQYLREFEPTVTWVKAIYRCYNFTRQAGTTTRPPDPRGMFEECKLIFLSDMKKMTTENKIPPELVLNADQTPCSYFSVGRVTMAARNASSVPIKGLTDKRNIVLTFVVTLSGEFLPMQVICRGVLNSPEDSQFPRIQNITLMKMKL